MGDIESRLTRRQLAARLGVTTRTLDRWRTEGLYDVRLTPSRLGGRVYYTPEQVERFLLETTLARDRELAEASNKAIKKRLKKALATLRRQGVRV